MYASSFLFEIPATSFLGLTVGTPTGTTAWNSLPTTDACVCRGGDSDKNSVCVCTYVCVYICI